MLNSLGRYYPIEAKPKHSGYLARNQHQVFYEEYGNPEGQPVLVVHGGPGAPVDANAQALFDPNFYRIIFIHQRGAGKSRYTEGHLLIDNTTPQLISDMDYLRKHLNIDKWTVFGGSWGAALSILYAEQYPENCNALILRGMSNASKEAAFSKLPRAGQSFPEQWEKITNLLTPEELRNFEETCYQRLVVNSDKALAIELIILNVLASALNPPPEILNYFRSQPDMCLAFAQTYAHYACNAFFMENPQNPLGCAAEKLNHAQINITLLHGAQDMNCLPEKTSIPFAEKVKHAKLRLIEGAGHFQSEANLKAALLETAEDLKEDLIRTVALEVKPVQIIKQYQDIHVQSLSEQPAPKAQDTLHSRPQERPFF